VPRAAPVGFPGRSAGPQRRLRHAGDVGPACRRSRTLAALGPL